jgi:CTP:molybdopterin cytidylyltransferase MocA
MRTQLVGSPLRVAGPWCKRRRCYRRAHFIALAAAWQGETNVALKLKRAPNVTEALEFAAAFVYPAATRRMRKREKIVPIILAAGSSQALPFPKALAPFGRQTSLEIAAENCSFLGASLVVLGSDARRILPHVPKSSQVVINRRWRKGQLSSLQAALRKIRDDAAFLIYPVDHALLKPETIEQLVRAFRSRSASQEIVMPRHKGAYGHPVIVSAAMCPEFFTARTAREVIYRVPERIRVLNVRTNSIIEDFHTLESYEECLRKFRTRK